MSMDSKSVVYKGDVYYDCLDNFVLAMKKVRDSKSDLESGQVRSERSRQNSLCGYSSDSENSVPDWRELAFEELGETDEVCPSLSCIFSPCLKPVC